MIIGTPPIFDTGDSLAQWFVPLASGIVRSIVIYIVNFEGKILPSIHSANYEGEVESAQCIDNGGWIGLYENGEWSAGNNECFSDPPIGQELWPALEDSIYTILIGKGNGSSYYLNIDTEQLGSPDLGIEPFFINIGIERTGGGLFGARQYAQLPYHAFKYYNQESPGGHPGWHILHYGWDLYLVVEYYEDLSPFIDWVAELETTISTEPREVWASIGDRGILSNPAGVDRAMVYWEANGEIDSSQMTHEFDTIYSGTIQGFYSGTHVTYWVEAVDLSGNRSYSATFEYDIFGKSPDARFLLLLDGFPDTGYPSQYYFYDAYDLWNKWWIIPSYDLWAYGPATLDLLNLYETIINIHTYADRPAATKELMAWLNKGGKNFLLAGDEVAGFSYGWPEVPVDIDTVVSDANPFFEYLGLDTYYGDINYSELGDIQEPWPISAIEGDVISGPLCEAFSTMLTDTAVLLYDPYYEISVENKLDGFDVDETVTVAFTAQPNPDSEYEVDTLAIGFYKEDESLNNKVVFLGFDPLSINSEPYIWWGATPYSPLVQAMDWMRVFNLVIENKSYQVPIEFELHQNYPNPFNPTTTIEFSIPQSGTVTLDVYDILGREVETILNEYKDADHHKLQWNARNVPSGVYLIKMLHRSLSETNRNFNQVKKVIVLR